MYILPGMDFSRYNFAANISSQITEWMKNMIMMTTLIHIPGTRGSFNWMQRSVMRISKEAQDYRPYNYMSIVVYLADGTKVVYDDMVKRAKMLAA